MEHTPEYIKLQTYFERLIEELGKRMDQRFHGVEVVTQARLDAVVEAIKVARLGMEHRLEGMNEWRAESKDRMGTYATQELVRSIETALDQKITTLRRAQDAQDARRGLLSGPFGPIALALFAIQLVTLALIAWWRH